MLVGTSTQVGGVQASTEARDRQAMGKDQFLTLLVAQLKHQDPLAPMENQEFTSQMAQFSTVEQLFSVNDNLIALQQISASVNNTQALTLIGKEIEAVGDSVHISGGRASSISFTLPSPADRVRVHILSPSGDVVRTIERGGMGTGNHDIDWDGRSYLGDALPDGLYTYSIDAITASGESIEADTYMRGIVEAISMEDGITYAIVGDKKIMMSDISEIRQPGTGETASKPDVSYEDENF